MDDPIDKAAQAGYLCHFLGAAAEDCPRFHSPQMTAAWLEGWNRRQADIDAVRSSTAERGNVNPETLGSIPAALPA